MNYAAGNKENILSPVLHENRDGAARITLNRPERLNALTREMMLDLIRVVEDAVRSPEVRVIFLTGAGRGFCAGQDLSERDPRELSGPLDLAAIQRELFHPVIRTLAETEKPVMACVNGIAAGAGVGLALVADIVVAAQSASFAFSFAKIGLSVDAGVGLALARALGPARARGLLMLGETISAAEAERSGLIWKAVEDSSLLETQEALLQRLARIPRRSIAGIKRAVAAALSSANLNDYLASEAAFQGDAGAHSDYREGVLAFLERRAANFS